MKLIQPRHPNGFACGHPAEYYNQNTANQIWEKKIIDAYFAPQ